MLASVLKERGSWGWQLHSRLSFLIFTSPQVGSSVGCHLPKGWKWAFFTAKGALELGTRGGRARGSLFYFIYFCAQGLCQWLVPPSWQQESDNAILLLKIVAAMSPTQRGWMDSSLRLQDCAGNFWIGKAMEVFSINLLLFYPDYHLDRIKTFFLRIPRHQQYISELPNPQTLV